MATSAAVRNDSALLWPLIWWLMKWSVIVSAVIALSFTITIYTTRAGVWARKQFDSSYAWALSALPRNEVVHIIEPKKVSIERVLDVVSSEMEFDPSILRAMALQESGGYTEANRVRDEPQLLEPWRDRAGKVHPARINPPATINGHSLTKIEKLMWASSHGVLQIVFGFHYKACGLQEDEWDRLHDPLTNIRCGAAILKSNLRSHRDIKDQSQRLWLALRDFNGAGDAAEEYADRVMSRIARLRNFDFGKGV